MNASQKTALDNHCRFGFETARKRFARLGTAYHIRRRLHETEEAIVGPAVDCRGTAEWNRRYDAAKMELPEMAKRLAAQEMMEVSG